MDYSATTRLYYLRQILESFDFQILFFGAGLENFRDVYSDIFNPPHNMWIQSLFELGIFSLLVQLFIVWGILKTFLQLKNNLGTSEKTNNTSLIVMGFAMCVFTLLIWSLYENVGFLNGSKHLFILVGAFIAGEKVVNRQLQEIIA